jgi:hypothetical protein
MRRELWNGNRETFRTAFSKYSIVLWVIRMHKPLRAKMVERLAGDHVVQLRTRREVEQWLEALSVEDLAAQPLEVDVPTAEDAHDRRPGLGLDEAAE